MQISSIGSSSYLYSLFGLSSVGSAWNQTQSNTAGITGTTDKVEISSDYTDFQSFLDKVKSGTVTDEDLQEMQEMMSSANLPSMQPPMPAMDGESTSTGVDAASASTQSSSTDMLSLQSFISKIADGTVTDEDLTEMQSLLTSMEEDGTEAMQSMPPMPPPPPPTGTSEEEDTFASFMDKVASGTVTEEDLTTMQELLAEVNASNTAGVGSVSVSSESESSDELTFESFLNKVANGTVTEDDLTEMQSLLSNLESGTQAAQNMPPMPPPPPPTGKSEDENAISSFMDKVASGTVTDEDLATMQELLTELEASGTTGFGTVSASSESDSTDELTFESFLDKVKNGTVTEEDLTEMQSIIASLTEEGTQGVQNMPPPPPISTGSEETDSALRSFLDKVQNGSVTDEDISAIQALLTETDETDTKSTVSATSESSESDELTLESFIEKLKDGSVTDEDLQEMQVMLTQWQDAFAEDESGREEDTLFSLNESQSLSALYMQSQLAGSSQVFTA